LDVEEEEVRGGLGDSLNGLEPIGAFGNHANFRMRREQLAQIAASELLIIHEDSLQCTINHI
jgi:hypothetical protein